MVQRAFRFRCYPNAVQQTALAQTWGCVRLVFNKALAWRSDVWKHQQRSVSYVETSAALTRWKRDPELAFLREVSTVPLQQSLRHLQRGFANFFAKRAKYPRFKARHRSNLSLEYTKSGFRFKGDQLWLAKMDAPLHVRVSREFPMETATSVTVTQDAAGRWHVSILCTDQVEALPATGTAVGVDLGVADALVLSDGRRLNPEDDFNIRAKQDKVVKYQRRLAKKTRDSNNYGRAKTKLAKAHATLTDARRDWLHKTTTDLVRYYDVIVIEDLNVAGMTRSAKGTAVRPGKNVRAKAGLNRSILNHAFGQFRQLLEYKANWYDKQVIVVDRYYPSSRTCSACGQINTQLQLKDRAWVCGTCQTVHDRDLNAATNICAAGLVVKACGDHVRPTA
jgi:putative transposase